jgi:diguanylate cyclase (GGDEF)-like protein
VTRTGPVADVPLRDAILELSARLASLLEERIDAGIEEALAEVGGLTGVDRAYVMMFDRAGSSFSNTHEWTAPGVTAEKAGVQGTPIERMRPWLPALERGEAVQIARVADLQPSEIVAEFVAQSIASMLWVPMPGPRGHLGFVGFDSVRVERTWDPEEVALLRAAANVIAAALERRDAASERDEVSRRLTALAALVPGAMLQFHMDRSGLVRFPYASPRVRTIFGIDPDALREDPELAFARVHPHDLSGLRASIERSRDAQKEWFHEFRTVVVGAAGDAAGEAGAEPRWIRGLATPERAADGGTLWHCILTDVTEGRVMEAALRNDVTQRREAQALLEREVAFRSALVGVTNDMLGSTLDDGFYQKVLTRTIELVPDAQGGSMVLRDGDGRYRFVATVGFDLEVLSTVRLTLNELGRSDPPAVERVFVRENRPNIGPERLEAIARAGRLADIEVTLSVPIIVAGEARGFMNLDNFEHGDAFDARAQAIAEALAAQVAVALQRLQLERDLDEERARYERLASHDALTGLPNRRLFQDRLEQAITRARRYGERIALIYIDLDEFKRVNDTLGHDVGDELLEAVAQRLVQAVRAADTVARLGGDEFAVVLQDVATDRDARLVAEKLLEAFVAPFGLRRHTLAVTASIGVAVHPRDAERPDALMKAADLAMYRVKDAGKGDFAFYSSSAELEAVDD